jgi:hypothetical protein
MRLNAVESNKKGAQALLTYLGNIVNVALNNNVERCRLVVLCNFGLGEYL